MSKSEEAAPPRRAGRPKAEAPLVMVGVRLPPPIVAAIESTLAARQRLDPDYSRQDLLRDAITRYVAPRRRKPTTAPKPRRAG